MVKKPKRYYKSEALPHDRRNFIQSDAFLCHSYKSFGILSNDTDLEKLRIHIKSKGESSKGNTNSGNSGHSTIAMQTAMDSTRGNPPPATPQNRDKNGQNVLHFAAARPHGRSAFYRLVEESRSSLSERDDKYRTPRDVASENDLQENVRAIDKYVINLAADGKYQELNELLLDGYDHMVDIDDDSGLNILESAQKKKQYKTVEFLRSVANFEERRDWLHKAIRVGSLPHVQYICDSADVARAKDEHARTSLHIATLCEEKEIMDFLATKYPELLTIGDNFNRIIAAEFCSPS
ncbi:hypothetical protein SK128_023323, partial [Halocaridina rubra]